MKTLIVVGCLLLAGCVAIPGYPTDLSKFSDKSSCKPDGQITTPIVVSIYHNNLREEQDSGEILFLVTIRGTVKEFLTVWSYGKRKFSGKEYEYEKYVHYAKTETAWQYIGEFELRNDLSLGERAAAQAVLDAMVNLLKSHLPEKYRLMEFKEFWEKAGCTTHGPVPFWWR